jgi:hypothetical protein
LASNHEDVGESFWSRGADVMAATDFDNGCTRDRIGELSLTVWGHSFIASCEDDSGGHVDGVDPISCVV